MRITGSFLTILLASLVVAGCQGEIERDTPLPIAPGTEYAPSAARLHRITAEQYRNIIADVLGEDIVLPPQIEDVNRVSRLRAIGSAAGSVSPRGAEQFEEASYQIAEQLVARGDFPCEAGGVTDDACVALIVRNLGRRLWRRPMRGDEAAVLVGIAHESSVTLSDFDEGLQYALAAMLQSPYFLFRAEVGLVQNGTDNRTLGPYEMAERLSFFLWNSVPDDALLDAAANGALNDPERLANEVDRMLADPRARRGVRAIFTDILHLDDLDAIRKDPTVFAAMSPEVGPSAREETLRVIEDLVFDREADYRELFTTRTTFINRKLASIYGVQAPAREGFGRFEHPASSLRSGILGHVSILALHSHVSATSATLRGAFVRQTLLCDEIPPPPPDVDTSIPEPEPGAATLRDRVRRHLEDPTCAGCHGRMDPIGLGLENFDSLGIYRDTDNGAFIDASGSIGGRFYRNPIEMGEALASNPDVPHCLTLTLHRYATGRRENPNDGLPLSELDESFADSGYRVLALMRALAIHPALRQVTGGAQ